MNFNRTLNCTGNCTDNNEQIKYLCFYMYLLLVINSFFIIKYISGKNRDNKKIISFNKISNFNDIKKKWFVSDKLN